MEWLTSVNTLNLIDVLDYYLILTFVVSTAVRIRCYRAILGLIIAFPHRWPKLLQLVKQYRTIFLTWPVLLAMGVTFALMLGNTLALRLVWVQARVAFADLGGLWLAFMAVIVSGGLMLFLDGQAIFNVGRFDRTALEEKLDQAEHWLQSWTAPALRLVSFGFVNPRKIVGDKVQNSLGEASRIVHGQMWRWSLGIGMRLAFGLSLWLTWALALRPAP